MARPVLIYSREEFAETRRALSLRVEHSPRGIYCGEHYRYRRVGDCIYVEQYSLWDLLVRLWRQLWERCLDCGQALHQDCLLGSWCHDCDVLGSRAASVDEREQ